MKGSLSWLVLGVGLTTICIGDGIWGLSGFIPDLSKLENLYTLKENETLPVPRKTSHKDRSASTAKFLLFAASEDEATREPDEEESSKEATDVATIARGNSDSSARSKYLLFALNEDEATEVTRKPDEEDEATDKGKKAENDNTADNFDPSSTPAENAKFALFSLNKDEAADVTREPDEDDTATHKEDAETSVTKEAVEDTKAIVQDEASNTYMNGAKTPQMNGASSDRPTLILHIGPHKTATSTLQCQLTYYRSFLYNVANYTYLGRRYTECRDPQTRSREPKYNVDTRGLVSCLDKHSEETPCNETLAWKKFTKALASMARKGHNAVISDEALSRLKVNDQNLGLLFGAIQPHFELRVAVVYRRYFSWLLSQYNEHYKPLSSREIYQKWPGEGGKAIKPFVDYYKNTKRQAESKKDYRSAMAKGNYQLAADRKDAHPVAYLRDLWTQSHIPYAPKPQDVIVVDMHDDESGGDVLVNFVRQAVSVQAAEELKQHKQLQHTKNATDIPSRNNPSVNLDYDMLAVQAREMGLFPKHEQLIRGVVPHYIESIFPRVPNDELPYVCLEENQMEELWNRSLDLEQTVFSQPSETRRQKHEADFAESKSKLKFCNLDTQKLLATESVQQMFQRVASRVH